MKKLPILVMKKLPILVIVDGIVKEYNEDVGVKYILNIPWGKIVNPLINTIWLIATQPENILFSNHI